MHTMAWSYPESPSPSVRTEYFRFLQAFPQFIPDEEMRAYFARLMENHPVSAYLDSRRDLVEWMHFMHNQVNARVGKRELTLAEALAAWNDEILSQPRAHAFRERKWREHMVYLTITMGAVAAIAVAFRR